MCSCIVFFLCFSFILIQFYFHDFSISKLILLANSLACWSCRISISCFSICLFSHSRTYIQVQQYTRNARNVKMNIPTQFTLITIAFVFDYFISRFVDFRLVAVSVEPSYFALFFSLIVQFLDEKFLLSDPVLFVRGYFSCHDCLIKKLLFHLRFCSLQNRNTSTLR